jgi:hypothetical protein
LHLAPSQLGVGHVSVLVLDLVEHKLRLVLDEELSPEVVVGRVLKLIKSEEVEDEAAEVVVFEPMLLGSLSLLFVDVVLVGVDVLVLDVDVLVSVGVVLDVDVLVDVEVLLPATDILVEVDVDVEVALTTKLIFPGWGCTSLNTRVMPSADAI